MSGFCDLNLMPSGEPGGDHSGVRLAVQLGYEVFCLNNFVETIAVKNSKKDKEKGMPLRGADQIKLSSDVLESLQGVAMKGRKVVQYTRFSTVLSDTSQVIRLQNDDIIQSHDIISVQPTTEKLFLLACKDLAVDIIAVDLTQRLPFFPKRTAVGCAMELRGPLDVCNLALLFGLTDAQAKCCLTSNCRSVLLHSAARKSAKGMLSIVQISSLPPFDRWKIPGHSAVDVIGLEQEKPKATNQEILLTTDKSEEILKAEVDKLENDNVYDDSDTKIDLLTSGNDDSYEQPVKKRIKCA